MQQYDDLDAIHIVSHGNAGELSLGNTKLNQNTLDSYVDDLISWRDSITDDGDILLYGCNVAASEVGKEFIEDLSQYTAADVLASTDLTGSEDLGGDWDLEYATGNIEEGLAFDAETQNGYQYILFGLDTFSGSYSGIDIPDITDSNLNFIDIGYDIPDITDNDFNFNGDFDLPDYSEPDDIANIDLEQYDFSNPAYNTVLLNFEPSQINFNANDFDYNSVDIDNNSITFGFKSGVEFAPSADAIESLEFDFDNYTFDFDSKFSFNADSVTFKENKVKFEFDSNSLNFRGADLFSADNVHLFEYKFLNNEITLPDGEITFADLNASDFRALDYAFPGDELFDGEYYFATNVIPADMNPFTDYVENGYKAGRNPNALFNVNYYLENNIDVKNNGMDPFKHYALYGYTENFDSRDPNPLFDSSYYSQKNPDVVAAGMNQLLHYMQFGWKESRIDNPGGFNPNRDPNAFFDTSYYFDKHIDVLQASYLYDSANPVQHMTEFGFAELRITNSYSESDKIAKITKVFSPNSDPGEISNLQKDLKKDGIKLSIHDDKSFEISQYGWAIDEDGSLNIFEPIEDAFQSLLIGGIALIYLAATEIIDGIGVLSEPMSYNVYTLPLGTVDYSGFSSSDYGDPDLEDLLRIRPFPGQTENQIAVEIFTTPEIDGIEDFTIFPEDSEIFLPTTGFPQGDKTLEAILNGGLFLGGEEIEQGAYFVTSERATLIEELAEKGIKHNPEDIVEIDKTPSGKIIFLETGNPGAGLEHIKINHGKEFAARGIAESEIPGVVINAVIEGKIVGYQGTGQRKRTIYETTINGKTERLAISVGTNGYIVGANFSSMK